MIKLLKERLQQIDTQLGNIARLRANRIVEDKQINDALFELAVILNEEHNKLVKALVAIVSNYKQGVELC